MPINNSSKIKTIFSLLGYPLLFLLIIWIGFFYLRNINLTLSNGFKFKFLEQTIGLTKNLSVIFIGIQIIQVVIFIIPGEITQVASGYFLGFWIGLFTTILGIFIGSSIAFFLSKILGINFLRLIIKSSNFRNFQKISSSEKSILSLFLLFLITGIPKDILCYFAGLTSIRYRTLIIISTIGRLPGIIGSLILGQTINQGDWKLVLLLIVASIIIYACALIFRKTLLNLCGYREL